MIELEGETSVYILRNREDKRLDVSVTSIRIRVIQVHAAGEMQGLRRKRSNLPFQALMVLWSEKTRFVIIYFVRYCW